MYTYLTSPIPRHCLHLFHLPKLLLSSIPILPLNSYYCLYIFSLSKLLLLLLLLLSISATSVDTLVFIPAAPLSSLPLSISYFFVINTYLHNHPICFPIYLHNLQSSSILSLTYYSFILFPLILPCHFLSIPLSFIYPHLLLSIYIDLHLHNFRIPAFLSCFQQLSSFALTL